MNAPSESLHDLAMSAQIVVCCGSGGVGKTTVSAALGLAAARRGRRVLVCTIDPAKRLANSMGVGELGNEPSRVPDEVIAQAGASFAAGGELYAMMLDTKRTFDRLVERHAPDAEAAARIMGNHVYIQFSSQLAGSQEYMAMERLYELHAEGGFDLIVLDTPPTKHALDFLHAPKRLSAFLQSSVLRWFLIPLKAGGNVTGFAARVASKVLGWLSKIFGVRLIEEVAEFFAAFDGLWGGFKERAEAVTTLLATRGVASFVIVSSPAPDAIDEALFFHRELRAHELPVGAFVINRVREDLAADVQEGSVRDALGGDRGAFGRVASPTTSASLSSPSPAADPKGDAAFADAIAGLLGALGQHQARVAQDKERIGRLQAVAESERLAFRLIPAQERDIHDLRGLAALDMYLVGAAQNQPAVETL